jgi:hydroxyacylglutathione hydrolase
MLVLRPIVQEEPWANGYLLIEGHHALMIDAVHVDQTVRDALSQRHITLDMILLTHGHYDHIVGLPHWNHHPCVIYLHPLDDQFLLDPKLNGSATLGSDLIVHQKTQAILHHQTIHWQGHAITVLHTPFHTPGSVCYHLIKEAMIFTGDTLFKQGIGRTDLPLSNNNLVKKSLKTLMALTKTTDVYPGHGDPTTIQKEWATMQSMMR